MGASSPETNGKENTENLDSDDEFLKSENTGNNNTKNENSGNNNTNNENSGNNNTNNENTGKSNSQVPNPENTNSQNNNKRKSIKRSSNQINSGSNQNTQKSPQEISEENLIKKNITNFKRINPDEYEQVKPITKEERNEQKLIDAIKNDDYDDNNNDCHEYMFFPMKDGKKQQNVEPLLKKYKKKKKMYTFTKDNDKKKENELAKILHINYDVKQHKFPYSIQKLKSDKPAINNEYLVIEYNMNKIPEEKREGDKKYELISRTVHTNYKNVELDNYEYTKHNGERYDYLEMNNDTNQIRRLNLMKKKGIKVIWGNSSNEENEEEDEKDEEKQINEKEENEDRYNNKYKKGQFTISKIY